MKWSIYALQCLIQYYCSGETILNSELCMMPLESISLELWFRDLGSYPNKSFRDSALKHCVGEKSVLVRCIQDEIRWLRHTEALVFLPILLWYTWERLTPQHLKKGNQSGADILIQRDTCLADKSSGSDILQVGIMEPTQCAHEVGLRFFCLDVLNNCWTRHVQSGFQKKISRKQLLRRPCKDSEFTARPHHSSQFPHQRRRITDSPEGVPMPVSLPEGGALSRDWIPSIVVCKYLYHSSFTSIYFSPLMTSSCLA